jgi:hypothetical protein
MLVVMLVFMGVVMLLFVMMLMSASFVMFFTSAYAQHCGSSDGGDKCVSEIHGSILCRLTVNFESLEFGGGKCDIAPPVKFVEPEVEYLFADSEIVERRKLSCVGKFISLLAFVRRNGRMHQKVGEMHSCGRGIADERAPRIYRRTACLISCTFGFGNSLAVSIPQRN